ncbi:hypothetical protein [Brevibacillus sp. NRS-1366]|uniref:hypothetical protein n=1 Tax=Brevibacillus sp. NRS-1366 TaxID=3233899 RepID=UPI003D20760F
MRNKSFVFALLLIVLAVVSYPAGMTTAAQGAVDEIAQIDQEIKGLQQTLDFFQSVAARKGEDELAGQIEQHAFAFFQRAKQLHEVPPVPQNQERKKQQLAVDKKLGAQKESLKQLQMQYEQLTASYWEQLLPELAIHSQGPSRKAAAAMQAADPVFDPFEPNDTLATSYPVTSGNIYNSKISSSTDMDHYHFNSGALTGTLDVTLYVPASVDYDLVVRESENKLVDFSITEELGGIETVSFQVKPNTTYYITVYSMKQHFSTTETYALRFGKVATVLTVAAPIDISLPAGEVPAYRFTAPETGTYRFYTGPYGGFGALNDTILYLFENEEMTKLLGYNDEATDGSLFSEIKIPMTQGVTYFVFVSHYEKEKGVHARLTAALDTKAAVSSPVIHEAAANDGSITEQQVVTLSSGVLAADVAASVAVSHLPAGLQPIITRSSDQQITIRFGGKALEHEKKHSVQNVKITIPKAKISGADADLVTSPFAIDFTDTEPLLAGTPQDIHLAAGMKKILKLTAPSTGSFEIFTGYYGGNPAEGTSNTWLGVYEDYAQTRLLASNDDGDQPPFSKVSLSLQSGQDYYVVLTSASSSTVHARLTVRYLGVEYVYNAKGQLIQMKQGGNILTEFTYDGNGNLIKKQVRK